MKLFEQSQINTVFCYTSLNQCEHKNSSTNQTLRLILPTVRTNNVLRIYIAVDICNLHKNKSFTESRWIIILYIIDL
jgi:hypothetical protein